MIQETPAPSDSAFTLFPKFPIEIRAKIWKYHIETQPQLVEPGVSRTRKTAIMGIDTGTRQEAFALHGHVSASFTPEHITVIHPEVDMLYISWRSTKLWGTSSLKEVLQACNALERVRSVAFYFEVEQNPKLDLFDSLRHCTSLEVVFVVMRERVLHSYLSAEEAALKRIGKFSWSYRLNLQAKLARGPKMLAPTVILVSEQMFGCDNEGPEGVSLNEFRWQNGNSRMFLYVRVTPRNGLSVYPLWRELTSDTPIFPSDYTYGGRA
jgi:hypothetical protein